MIKITEFPGKKGNYFFGSVKVGERGQIVIPLKAREIFGINAKDDIHIFGELNKGLGLTKILEIDENEIEKHEYYFGTAKVGERGQIVIPQDARETFKINPGDLILVFGDITKGLGLMKATRLKNFASQLFQGFASGLGEIQENDKGDLNNEE
ncbi:MAG: AbrB/MazE/SpoVT family DNA-binding domain-containing protein [Candidatus Odinarchaeota archaeon]